MLISSIHSVYVYNGAKITVGGEVAESGGQSAVHATNYASVTVEKDVEESGDSHAIYANNATVEIKGDVEENDAGTAVYGYGDTQVSVKGSVTEHGDDHAINASNGAIVIVNKDVVESGAGVAIKADGTGTSVKIAGNVTGEGSAVQPDDQAIQASSGAYIEVGGNVIQNGYNVGIYANDATVKVGENVSAGSAIVAYDGNNSVVVEGLVTGSVTVGNTSDVYLGQLNGDVFGSEDHAHYLIGTADETITFNDLIIDSNILAKNGENFATIDGIEQDEQSKRYLYTSSSVFSGGAKTITLKSKDSNKQLQISGLPTSGVSQETNSNTGEVKLTLNGDFKGGLQNLILTLKDILNIIVNNDGNGTAESNPTRGAQGTAVDLAATANSNYEFDYWEVVSGNVTIDNNKFNIGTEDVVIKAHFKEAPQPDPKPQTSSSAQTLFTGNTGNPVTNGRWTKNADGTWTYTSAYKFSNTWGYIANPNDAASAAWYYFDRNGNMLTGWQKLYWNGAYRWYYFSQTKDANEGKCQLGGITPDGYVLNPDGSWKEN